MKISPAYGELHQRGDSRARQITSLRAPQSDQSRKTKVNGLGAVRTKAVRIVAFTSSKADGDQPQT
jgi:hypothetical protein